jgi:hypothetical protein
METLKITDQPIKVENYPLLVMKIPQIVDAMPQFEMNQGFHNHEYKLETEFTYENITLSFSATAEYYTGPEPGDNVIELCNQSVSDLTISDENGECFDIDRLTERLLELEIEARLTALV